VPLHFHTARIPHHTAPGYAGPGALNITRGSGGAYGGAFAPSRPLLDAANACKRLCKRDEAKLELLFAWYTELYLPEMRASYRLHRHKWDQLLARVDVVTLTCYCGTAHRCHRALLAGVLVKLGAVYLGERPPEQLAQRIPHPPRERQPGEEG
jgi:uncharacterized protein YeaO (DUF488 family)